MKCQCMGGFGLIFAAKLLLGVSKNQDHRVASDEKLGDEAVLVDRRGALLAFPCLGDLRSHYTRSGRFSHSRSSRVLFHYHSQL